MSTDPTTYIVAAVIVSFCIGFYAASLICAHRIRRASTEGWKEAVRFYHNQQSRQS